MGSAPPSGPSGVEPRPGPVPWREIFSGSLGRLALGLFLLEILTAVQILVVATVMPVISRDLDGLGLYGWAFSAGGLATVITIPPKPFGICFTATSWPAWSGSPG